jgi:trans-aconitate 2-methyltransferase
MADWDGARYEQVNTLQRFVADRALAGLTVRGDEDALDVGCGDGAITARIADLLPDGTVRGIDASPRMIAAARERHPGIGFEIGDVLTMRFDPSFALLTSFNVLHWVADLRTAFERIHAAVRPGGRALLQFVGATDRPSLEATAMAVCGRAPWASSFPGFAPPFRHPEPDEANRLATAAGFEVRSSTMDDLRWDFPTAADFADWVRVGFGDWAARIPGRDADFVADVLARYADVTGSDRTLLFAQLRLDLRRPTPPPPRGMAR